MSVDLFFQNCKAIQYQELLILIITLIEKEEKSYDHLDLMCKMPFEKTNKSLQLVYIKMKAFFSLKYH